MRIVIDDIVSFKFWKFGGFVRSRVDDLGRSPTDSIRSSRRVVALNRSRFGGFFDGLSTLFGAAA